MWSCILTVVLTCISLMISESHSVVCPSICNPMDYSAYGILQARILEWVAVPFLKGSSQPRDWNQVSHIAGRCFTILVPREALWHREPCSVFCNDLNEKRRIWKRRDTCICLTVLRCTPETNTLLINYTPVEKRKENRKGSTPLKSNRDKHEGSHTPSSRHSSLTCFRLVFMA